MSTRNDTERLVDFFGKSANFTCTTNSTNQTFTGHFFLHALYFDTTLSLPSAGFSFQVVIDGVVYRRGKINQLGERPLYSGGRSIEVHQNLSITRPEGDTTPMFVTLIYRNLVANA